MHDLVRYHFSQLTPLYPWLVFNAAHSSDCLACCFRFTCPCQTKAKVHVFAVRGPFPVASGGTQVLRFTGPGAISNHALPAAYTYPGSAVTRRVLVIEFPAILYLLSHVAMHVMQAQRIGRITPHRSSYFSTGKETTATTTVCPVAADVITPIVLSGTPGPRRILLLRLRRQTVSPTVLLSVDPPLLLPHQPSAVQSPCTNLPGVNLDSRATRGWPQRGKVQDVLCKSFVLTICPSTRQICLEQIWTSEGCPQGVRHGGRTSTTAMLSVPVSSTGQAPAPAGGTNPARSSHHLVRNPG